VEWGFFMSTVLLWQVSYGVNSLAHVIGRRRFETSDTSRNSWILALLSLGDGWHNNHHFYPGSMRAGFYWWEVDVTGYIIRALARVGLVWNVRAPPRHVLELGRRRQPPPSPVAARPLFDEQSNARQP
jgi:stearoyl-CoA desaturase (Delta-9 desaturase)